MSEFKSGLQYDELGFLIGLKQTGKDVSKIDKNVEQIRDILIGLHKEIENQYSRSENQPRPKLSALEQALIDAQIKPADFADLIREQANPLVQSSLALDRVAKSIEDLISESLSSDSTRTQTSNPKPKRSRRTIDINSTEDVIREFGNGDERQRDANGRFVGSKSEQSTLGKVAQTIGTAIKGIMPSNPQGVDPTLDAINEVANVLSPVKRAAGFMLRPLTGWMKSRKRNEPIPKEQSDHNRRQVKLLQRIADNLQSRGGLLGGLGKLLGAGGGLLGSLFGGLLGKGKGLGKGLSKILKFGKGLPIVGALLTAMSFSDWGSQTTKEKGGTVGSLAGGLAGGALGSILGPVGTIAGAAIGSWVGDKLGGVVAPYVKEWTDSLIDADIPTMISKLVSLALKLTPGGMAKSLYDWGKEKWNEKFNGQPNPSYLLRRQYGGKGENGGEPVKFGAAAQQSFSTSEYAPLLDEIAGVESKKGAFGTSGYDAIYGGATVRPPKPISQMTVGEFKNYQNELVRNGSKSSAGGRYQFIRGAKNKKTGEYAFAQMVREAGLKDSDKMTPENQDKLAIHYLGGKKQLDQWIKTGNSTALANKTAQQFAGMKNSNGVGNYDGDGLNKAHGGGVDVMRHVGQQILNNQKSPLPIANNAIKNQAETILQKAKSQTSMLNTQSAITPVAARSNNLAANYMPPKVESNVLPAKEFLTSPAPQEVVVKNQNSGNINQNVSNRLLAHAITGGLGMGGKFNG